MKLRNVPGKWPVVVLSAVLMVVLLVQVSRSTASSDFSPAAGPHQAESALYRLFGGTELAFLPIVDSCRIDYQDDFSNPNSGWPKINSDTVFFGYAAGEYRMLLKNPNWFGGVYPGVTFKDYTVTTDLRNVNNREGLYGLIVEHLSWSAFRVLLIDNAGNYEFWSYFGDWELEHSGNSPYLKVGTASNRIGIQNKGEWFNVFANGKFLAKIQGFFDSQSLHVGLIAISGSEANLDIRFDNFWVEPITCGWGAYPVSGPQQERPQENTGPDWADIELPAGLFDER